MHDPQRPADLLAGILKQAKAQAATSASTRALTEVLGADAAARCTVVSERGGRLLIDVDSAPLFSELQAFRREEVRTGINERLSDRQFAQVSFRLHQR